jgi:hypothetical protein
MPHAADRTTVPYIHAFSIAGDNGSVATANVIHRDTARTNTAAVVLVVRRRVPHVE